MKLLVFGKNSWNNSTVCEQMSSGLFINITYKILSYKSYILYMYLYV